MNLEVSFQLNLKTKEVKDAVHKAAKQAMKDTVIDIANDAVKNSRKKHGNNARSITYEVGPGGEVAKEEISGAVYSTSGYGGYLETGTRAHGPKTKPFLVWEDDSGDLIFAKHVRGIPPMPYFKPALDRNFTQEKFANRVKEHLK